MATRGHARTEARSGARLARCAARTPRAASSCALGGAVAARRWRWSTALALATHSPTDPSLTTAAGGPPANWLGQLGAYVSDALLLLFGIGSVLLLPVIALAGLRMLRLAAGRAGRPRAAARRARRDPARHRARPDQRLGGVGPARRLGRSARPCRGLRRRCRHRADRQPVGRRPGAARGPACCSRLAGWRSAISRSA